MFDTPVELNSPTGIDIGQDQKSSSQWLLKINQDVTITCAGLFSSCIGTKQIGVAEEGDEVASTRSKIVKSNVQLH